MPGVRRPESEFRNVKQVCSSEGETQVAVECALGTRVIVVLSEPFDPWDTGVSGSWGTRDDVVALVDDWASRRGCPCCGGCLTLAAVDVVVPS